MRVSFCILMMSMMRMGASLEFVIDADTYEPMPLLCLVDKKNEVHSFVEKYLKPLLGATRQFNVHVETKSLPRTKKDIEELFKEGYPLVLFFDGDEKRVSWRLYDTMSIEQLKGKEHRKNIFATYQWALDIAETIWPELTSQRGSFSSLIAACKHKAGKNGRINRDIYLIHPFYSRDICDPIKLVSRGNNVAPRWHSRRDVLFFSQHTPTNVRLMSVDPHHTMRTITSFDGQNMTPALSADGRVVLSLSNKDHSHLYEYVFDKKKKKSAFVRLTRGQQDAISPSFLNENEVVFCSINELNVPRLGVLHLDTKDVSWLKLGRALCPAASPAGDKIAFCRKVGGNYQLWLYDRETEAEEQLTRCAGNKDECAWSPCGNYLVCAIDKGDSSRLAIVDICTRVVRYITPDTEKWSYPSWSAHFSLPFSFSKMV